jgi:DNA polymerase-3 subunit delta'
LLVEPEGSSLKIEQIREYQRDVSLKAWEGRYKILILDGTDKLTPEAANSLLKTLEEPPPATVIILISVNPFSLFPTLLSRCQLIRFGPLKKVETAKILKEGQLLDESQARLLVSLCGGKVGQALALDLDHVLSMREQVWELLKPDEGSSVDFLIRRARELSKDKEELDFLLSLLSSLSRDIVVLASGSDLSFLMNEDIGAKLYGLAKSLSPTQALKVWETIEQAREFLRQNVNGQLVLESMLVDIYRLLR